MIRSSIAIIFLLVVTPMWAEEECVDTSDETTPLQETAESITKTCSAIDLQNAQIAGKASLASFYGEDPQKLCKCLSEAKFNEARVPRGRQKQFQQFEYDRTIREKLAHSLNDLVGNFTKFNNLILTKTHLGNLAEDGEQLCNIQTLADEVAEIQKKEGTPACPSPKGFMANRIKAIFGTTDMKGLPDKLSKSVNEVPANSCMSNQMYLNMRSNSGASSQGFKFLNDSGKSIESYRKHFHEDSETSAPLKDLLSYDVIFNLAYRDPEFKDSLQKRIKVFTTEENGRLYDIYNDEKTLKLAYKHLNNSCLQLSQNLKGFLCANEYPKMNPSTLNLHLDDYFKNEKEDPIIKASMRDFFTYDFACNPQRRANTYMRTVAGVLAGAEKKAVELSEEEKKFDEFIDNTILVKNATKDVFSTSKGSDFNQFNQMFCKYKSSDDPVRSEDLPDMLKGYLSDLQKRGVNLAEILAPGSELSKKLGLAIDPSKIPMFLLTKQEDIDAGKLPKINQFKWESEVAGILKSKGISEEEVGQIYAMIEMQTNRRFSEIEDLKKKLASENEGFNQIDLSEIDAVVRKDPDAVARVQNRMLSAGPTSNPVAYTDLGKWIDARHKSLTGDRSEDASVAQSVLMNKTDIQEVKDDAQTYNSNMGTYDSTYVDKVMDVNPDFAGIRTFNPNKFNGSEEPIDDSMLDVIRGAIAGTHHHDLPRTKVNGGDLPTLKEEPKSEPSSGDQSSASGSGSVGGSSLATAVSNITPSSTNNNQASFYPAETINRSPASQRSSNNDTSDSHQDMSSNNSSRSDSLANSLQDEISRIENQIRSNQQDIARRQRELNKLKSAAQNNQSDSSFNSSPNLASSSSYNPTYNYPQNVPFKNTDGSYSYPPNNISELSSSGEQAGTQNRVSDTSTGSSHSGSGSAGGSAVSGEASAGTEAGSSSAGGAGAGSAALAGLTGNLPGGRGPASKETEEEARKRLKIPLYEHHKIIPHAIVDVVGSIDKAVILLGLEGMRFKTIEGVDSPVKDSTETSVKYFIRTYDFVPEGQFDDYKEDFESEEARLKAHTVYFSFPRTKENLAVSKKFASATKEILKEEVSHNYVLQIQNDIMNEKELRSALNNVSEKLR